MYSSESTFLVNFFLLLVVAAAIIYVIYIMIPAGTFKKATTITGTLTSTDANTPNGAVTLTAQNIVNAVVIVKDWPTVAGDGTKGRGEQPITMSSPVNLLNEMRYKELGQTFKFTVVNQKKYKNVILSDSPATYSLEVNENSTQEFTGVVVSKNPQRIEFFPSALTINHA